MAVARMSGEGNGRGPLWSVWLSWSHSGCTRGCVVSQIFCWSGLFYGRIGFCVWWWASWTRMKFWTWQWIQWYEKSFDSSVVFRCRSQFPGSLKDWTWSTSCPLMLSGWKRDVTVLWSWWCSAQVSSPWMFWLGCWRPAGIVTEQQSQSYGPPRPSHLQIEKSFIPSLLPLLVYAEKRQNTTLRQPRV